MDRTFKRNKETHALKSPQFYVLHLTCKHYREKLGRYACLNGGITMCLDTYYDINSVRHHNCFIITQVII